MISVDDALRRILAKAVPLAGEKIDIHAAAGRVLAAPLVAKLDNPPFDASAMDGYAVRASDVAPGKSLRLIGTSQAGAPFNGSVGENETARIFTGAPVPSGADSIAIQEEADTKDNRVSFRSSVKPGAFIRHRGRDFKTGQEVLPAGTRLEPFALALAAACAADIVATRRPRIAIVSTGDELVSPGLIPGPSQIVASNAVALASLISPLAVAEVHGIAPDEPGVLTEILRNSLTQSDVLITSGGASVGDRDYVLPVLQSLGVTIEFWKIAMRPGKPLMFGTLGSKLIFGLPGNPVSALVTSVILVLPALRRLAGLSEVENMRLSMRLAKPCPANGPRRHYLRGRILPGGEVMPIAETDSGHVSSIATANCLIEQAENDPGLLAGAAVQVIPLRGL